MGLPLHFSERYTRWLGFNHTHDLAIEIEKIVSSTGNISKNGFTDSHSSMIHKIYRISVLDYPASLNELRINKDSSALFRG
jgi:hypothetical protein